MRSYSTMAVGFSFTRAWFSSHMSASRLNDRASTRPRRSAIFRPCGSTRQGGLRGQVFRHEDDADKFTERFGGEYMTPTTRPKF
jgi:hypothetical protein